MKKNIFLLAFLCTLSISSVVAQTGSVGIGTNSPNANAILELNSSNKGLLMPRVALVATTNASPLTQHVAGMHVYNTAAVNDVTPGEYYNDGTKWLPIATYTPATSITSVMAQNVRFSNESGDMNAYQYFPGVQLTVPEKGKYMVIMEHFLAVDYTTTYYKGSVNNNGSTISYYIGLAKNNQGIAAHDTYHFYNIKFTSGQNLFVFDANAGDIIKPYFVSGGPNYTHDLWTATNYSHTIPRNKMTMIRIR